SAKADRPYTVDLDGPDSKTTQLSIDTVAGDDIVNLAESKTTQIISGRATGEFQAGDKVSFTLNGHTYSTTVNAEGEWSVSVAGSDLAEETNIHAVLMAKDAAGNVGVIEADHAYSVDLIPPVATLTINVVAGDDIVNSAEAATNQVISGTVSGDFTAGDKVSFTLDGTTYSASVASDGTWSVSVPGSKLVAETDHTINATLVAHDAAGNVADVTASHAYQVQLNSLSITSMSKDSAIDTAHSTDFITADGSAGRGVYGTLTQTLTAGQKVQISTDGGTTWKDAVTTGTNWVAVDTGEHTANWTIQARIVENGVAQGDVTSKAVTFLGTVGAPSITSIPDADTTYTTAKAADGSDVKVSLAGTNAKAGDTLHIVWGDTTYDQVLTAADITAGTVTAKVPAQQTTTQGGQWDFAVTAQIVTQEGQISKPSEAFQVYSQGWTTLAIDDLQRYLSTENGASVYQGGGITVTSSTTMNHAVGDSASNAGLAMPSTSASDYMQVNFATPVGQFSVNISALAAAGSRVVVYDTKGNILSDTVAKPDGTGGKASSISYSYTAPVGTDIGKVMVYNDGNGIVLDTLKFYQLQHQSGYVDTFTNEVGKTTTGAGYHSDEGHFTVTSKGTVSIRSTPEHNLEGPYMYIGTGSSVMNNSAAIFTFDQPVQSIAYSLWGLETQTAVAGNGSWLEVYDTNGKIIFNRFVINNGVGSGTYNYEQISYTAPEGISIGKAVVYQDLNGTLLDNFTTTLAPTAPSGQMLIDHNWETYFDEASVAKAVVWQAQTFTTQAFNGGASLANYHSDTGGFTITGSATKTAAGGNMWANATTGSMYVAADKMAVVSFDSARSKVELGITGIEKGNTAYLRVYDTDGTLLDTIQMTNPTGTYDIQSFAYDAHENSIGRIEIVGDTGGSHITSITSSVTQVTAADDVISLAVDPVAYFAQDGAHIFGSHGTDTLKLTGANQVLDLRTLAGDNDQAKISSIEKFDITGTGNNTLKISLNDVLNLGETDLFRKDGKVQVLVDGDAGDKVELYNLHDHGTAPGVWQSSGTASIGGATYNVYSYSQLDAEVLIKQAVTSSIV
ncbi:Ig-like domain-containing protein, partial [Pseudomonas nitroreducens]